MREKIENLLYVEVADLDLTTLSSIEFYVRQGDRFWQYSPTVVSASAMTVRIPLADAMCLKQGSVKLQFAFVDNTGTPRASEVETVSVRDLLKNAGYAP